MYVHEMQFNDVYEIKDKLRKALSNYSTLNVSYIAINKKIQHITRSQGKSLWILAERHFYAILTSIIQSHGKEVEVDGTLNVMKPIKSCEKQSYKPDKSKQQSLIAEVKALQVILMKNDETCSSSKQRKLKVEHVSVCSRPQTIYV